MSNYLAEAHNEWHTVHGKFASCPLDCGANEPDVWDCVCGATCYAYPSDPSDVIRECTDPAACDKVIAANMAQREAERAAEQAAQADDPWAMDPPF